MNNSSKKRVIFSTKWIAYTAMLTALVVATMFIPPVPTVAGRIYWVDGIVLLAAYLMDPLSAFICGGIGTLIYDSYYNPVMMVPTLFIHGLQAVIVSAFLHYVFPNRFKKYEWVKALIVSVIGAVEVVLGYFVYRCITLGVPTAVASIPRNIIQEIIGILIAMIICYATTFKKQLEKARLLPDFTGEMLQKKQPAATEEQSSVQEQTEN